MKFNLCAVTMAAMVVSVTARPDAAGMGTMGKGKSMAVRHVRSGAVGEVFRRGDDEDEDEDEDADADADEDEDADADENEDSDSSSSSSAATATGSAAGSTITGSPSTGTSSGSTTSGGSLPASSGTSALDATQTIAAGGSFDGGMVMFDRGVSCTGQEEGDDSDAVFQIEEGGTLSNVIIGPNQIEGIHCQGACTLNNVWWSAVCEDAFTIKNQDASATTTITGGGAFGADDKVLQHNGAGTMSVSGFTVEDFGKLYRACGNCDSSYERHVIISDCTATNGDLVAGINSNFGDTATISGLTSSGVETICERFEGIVGGEPESLGTGADGTYCIIE